jgi:putative hemin transport protein
MAPTTHLSDDEIQQACRDNAQMRERDLADKLGISEARLLAAQLGRGVTRITSDMDALIPAVMRFGEVMALTRNESCVIEKTGVYEDYRGGPHAALVVNEDIDLRMFPGHWMFGFAVEKRLADGSVRRSLQVFDAAGDAVHKVFLKENSVEEEWPGVVAELRLPEQSSDLQFRPRQETEPAKGTAEKSERLRAEWDKITDTHQFLLMVKKLKMNRLGAYRVAGAPYTRALQTSAVADLLERAREMALPIMVFVGNRGCIEIHTGPIETVKFMGPWLNVLDPRFNLHLRNDHIAEVWQATKSTRRGDAVSVEAFDKDGMLILQVFGVLADPEAAAKWNDLVAGLPSLQEEAVA